MREANSRNQIGGGRGSDQNFPAVIPVEGDGDCFKILQVENATLSDLTTVFLAALEGFTVPAGTIVLISSVSHLAAVGTARRTW